MPDNAWFEQYKIGVPLIDADHLNLFMEVARFNEHLQSGMSAEELGKSLNFLDKYVGAHFAREEMLMREKAYPYYTQHKALHLQLKKVVFAVRRVFETDIEKVDKKKLNQFLRDWLIEHILKVDTKLVPYVNGAYSNDSHSAERLQFIGLSEKVTIDEDLVEITVKVPQSKQKVIERCAFALMHNTPEAQDLEEIALAATGMTIEEAMELANAVLY
jgi:hemerythrin